MVCKKFTSKVIWPVLLILLLSLACVLRQTFPSSQAIDDGSERTTPSAHRLVSTFTPKSSVMRLPVITKTNLLEVHISTLKAAVTHTSSPPPAVTPTPAVEAGLADFPSTILYQSGAGGFGDPCYRIMDEQSPRGIAADFGFYTHSITEALVVCVWGLPMDRLFRLVLTSPDGKQSLMGEFGMARAEYYDYRVVWPDMEGFDVGLGSKRDDGVPYAAVSLWWPIGLQMGTWTLKAVTGGQTVQGKFVVPEVKYPWISSGLVGKDLQPQGYCRILPVGSAEGPIPVVGGGFQPDQGVPLALYNQQTSTSQWVRQQVVLIQADSRGNLETTLALGGVTGVYRLVPWTSETRQIIKDANSRALDGLGDCFVAR